MGREICSLKYGTVYWEVNTDMDYIVHILDIKPFEVKAVNLVELREDSYFLYDENGSTLLAAPREKVKCIASKEILHK